MAGIAVSTPAIPISIPVSIFEDHALPIPIAKRNKLKIKGVNNGDPLLKISFYAWITG